MPGRCSVSLRPLRLRWLLKLYSPACPEAEREDSASLSLLGFICSKHFGGPAARRTGRNHVSFFQARLLPSRERPGLRPPAR